MSSYNLLNLIHRENNVVRRKFYTFLLYSWWKWPHKCLFRVYEKINSSLKEANNNIKKQYLLGSTCWTWVYNSLQNQFCSRCQIVVCLADQIPWDSSSSARPCLERMGKSQSKMTEEDFAFVVKHSTLGRCAKNQNGNLRWHLPLGVRPPPP